MASIHEIKNAKKSRDTAPLIPRNSQEKNMVSGLRKLGMGHIPLLTVSIPQSNSPSPS